ncbi:MAG: hypothetical protein M1592_01075 [Candidatus Thermoplasmatota archaeon]|nr:hypothetical protein [Candidatus Thermoplasmatota archaeon]MCL5881162.1 hypothetical protein [Candidatus Thermoplasmatota archaeon]
MKSTTRRVIFSSAPFITIYLAIFLIPQLVQSSRITLGEGVALALPFSIAVAFILLKFGQAQSLHHIRARIFLVASVFSYTFIGSVVYILSAHGTVNRLLLLIPIDVVILAVPSYLLYRIGKPAILNPEDLSHEYTERLHRLLGTSDDEHHGVYISRKRIVRSYAETSNGKDWHVLLNQDAIQQLDPYQIDAVLLDAYYSHKNGVAKKLILGGAAYVIVSVDLLLIPSILVTLISSAYFIYPLIFSVIGFVMIVAIPFFILSLTQFLQSNADRDVIRHLSNADSFTSAIQKKSSLMIPLRPMTQKQQMRYSKRVSRITEKRINKIRKFIAASGKV